MSTSSKARQGDDCGPSFAGCCAKDPQKHSGTGGIKTMKYLIIYEKTATGYSAYAPDLPGCIAGGFTFEETAELMRGAIQMHLEAMRSDGDPIPEPSTRAEYIEAPAA
jgi:predicted RNase H-like HicB family nuclease